MGKSRLFIPQEALDRWVAVGEAELDGAELWLRSERRRFKLIEAVRVLGEISGAPDAFDVAGKVKTVGYMTELGAELLGESMIVGENVFETVIGFLAAPVAPKTSLPAARPGSDEELLAQFLGRKL
jgi:hypothetical protein